METVRRQSSSQVPLTSLSLSLSKSPGREDLTDSWAIERMETQFQ